MLKFVLVVIFILAAGIFSKEPAYILGSVTELFIIMWLCGILAAKGKKTAYILNFVFCFIILFQQGVLYYTGSFTSLLMLENVREISALGSSIYKYAAAALIFFAVACLPYKTGEKYFGKKKILLGVFIVLFSGSALQAVKNDVYPPVTSLCITAYHYWDAKVFSYFNRKYSAEVLQKFHKTVVVDENAALPLTPPSGKPNIILIFSEGLSAEVIDKFSSLDLNLTPNINGLYEKSAVFTNYYNHTAATFRGIRGQLISGYQLAGGYHQEFTGLGDMSKNETAKATDTRLISLVDILKGMGYKTFFIGGAEKNFSLTNYLNAMHFDKVYTSADIQTKNSRLSDRETFNLLGDLIEDGSSSPYFIGVYSIGTHFGADASDKKYADGKNVVLNNFHNYDAQLGVFLERFWQSDAADNTILIFTADHAAYPSPEYRQAFKSRQRTFISTIPLFLYWKDIPHKVFDAKNRNSLDLTPTILHLLGVYKHENYFLGRSLFSEEDNKFDKISAIVEDYLYTGDEADKDLTEELSLIAEFYMISLNSN